MARKKISQAQARRYKKALNKLEADWNDLFNRLRSDFPGVRIDTMTPTSEEWHIINTARKLGCAVVVLPVGDKGEIAVYAMKEPKQRK